MKKYLAATVAALLAAGSAHAADFSFTGLFTQDNDKAAFDFTVGATSTVTLKTLSYAGGTNSLGAIIARGGFDPILSLYDSTGIRVGQNDDGGSLVPADSVTGAEYDTYLSVLLNPGTYTVYVTQFDNFAPDTIPGAFPADGNPNFRNGFVDAQGDKRDGHWAFDILNVDAAVGPPAAVPEPATWAMMLTGFGLVGAAARRRKPALQTA